MTKPVRWRTSVIRIKHPRVPRVGFDSWLLFKFLTTTAGFQAARLLSVSKARSRKPGAFTEHQPMAVSAPGRLSSSHDSPTGTNVISAWKSLRRDDAATRRKEPLSPL